MTTGEGRIELMMTGEVLDELRINRLTLYKWIDRGIITALPVKKKRRTFFVFDRREVLRVKSLLKKDREKGKTLLKAQRVERRAS